MPYKAPTTDQLFVLREVLGLESYANLPGFADAPFASAVAQFHLSKPVARASVTMAECAALASGAAKIAAE